MTLKNNQITSLISKLISIPSWVDKQTNEQEIGEFIIDFLRTNTKLKVIKQPVTKKRFNIIAKDKYPPKTLIIGHMDTVQPRKGWETNPTSPVIKNKAIYGLGASDMKGNIGAVLSALKKVEKTKGLMIVFYTDEEYDFLGTKKFVSEYKNKIDPEYIISLDGSDLKILTGCRGLIEIKFRVKGVTGHAAKPKTGKNAIYWSFKSIENLSNYLKKFSNKDLGETSINLAFLQGGLMLGENNNNLDIGRQGNNIANISEFIIDIRPADKNLDAKKVISKVKNYLSKNKLELIKAEIRHNSQPWLTKKSEIKKITETIGQNIPIIFANPEDNGFIDVQMFWKSFNKVPCITIGAGEGKLAHKPNEYIKVSKLNKLEKVCIKIINKLCYYK